MTDDPRVEGAHAVLKEISCSRSRCTEALAAADKAAWRTISEYDPAKHGEVVDLWAGGRRALEGDNGR